MQIIDRERERASSVRSVDSLCRQLILVLVKRVINHWFVHAPSAHDKVNCDATSHITDVLPVVAAAAAFVRLDSEDGCCGFNGQTTNFN